MRPTLPLATALLATAAAAQEPISVSEDHVLSGRALVTGGGFTKDGDYHLSAAIGLAPFPGSTTDGVYVLYPRITGDATLNAAEPWILTVAPDAGDAGGGEAVELWGFGFDDGGALTDVRFAGAPAGGVTVASNTHLLATAPPGTNAFGNPLGAVDVTVQNGNGSGVAADAFVYTPAMVQDTPVHVGSEYQLSFRGEPGSFHQLSIALTPSPGIGVPIPPLDGALEIFPPWIQLTPFALSATGHEVFTFDIPDNPSFAGVTFEFQSVSITSFAPLEGSFTNKLDVLILP